MKEKRDSSKTKSMERNRKETAVGTVGTEEKKMVTARVWTEEKGGAAAGLVKIAFQTTTATKNRAQPSEEFHRRNTNSKDSLDGEDFHGCLKRKAEQMDTNGGWVRLT